MELGLSWGYWGRKMPAKLVELSVEAERVGFDAVWTAEAWGSDVFSPLVYIAAHTKRIKLGTGIAQIAARSPASTAMHAITLDHLSGGRAILGIGVSGPQVVEGWHGQPSARPLERSREYVEILRRILRREEPLAYEGKHFQMPYIGAGSQGLGKALKAITHPLREIPIWIAAKGPKNVAQAVEIADGWLPFFYSPFRPDLYGAQLAMAKPGFGVAATATIDVCEDIEEALLPVKALIAFYVGGMGSKERNYYADLLARAGYEAEAKEIAGLFAEGKRKEATMAVPSEFADEISLVGSEGRIRDRLQAWEESPVTMLNVPSTDRTPLPQIANLVKG